MPNVFVDTNVILYTRDRNAPAKAQACAVWLRALARSRAMTISRQVINEAYFNLTRPRLGVPEAEAREAVSALERFVLAPSNAQSLRDAWALQDRHRLQFWDALLLASANAAACETFLSEDLNDGQVYGGVRVVDPFRHAPEDVLGRPASTS